MSEFISNLVLPCTFAGVGNCSRTAVTWASGGLGWKFYCYIGKAGVK
jgi:hypothetical protein